MYWKLCWNSMLEISVCLENCNACWKLCRNFKVCWKMFMLGMLKTVLKYKKPPSHFMVHVEIKWQRSENYSADNKFLVRIYTLFRDCTNTCITFPLTWCTSHEYKTGNDVSEFKHSNWITLSYHSSPIHKSLIPKYLIHFSHFCTQ